MINRISIILLTAMVGIFGTLGESFAETETTFNSAAQAVVSDDVASGQSPASDVRGWTITDGIQNPIDAIMFDRGDSSSSSSSSSSGKIVKLAPGQREIPITSMITAGVRGGFVDPLYDARLVSATRENMESPLIVQNVTLSLTEPAVAEGVARAQVASNNRYMAALLEDIRLSNVSNYFQGSETFVKAYFHCLDEEMNETGRSFVDAKAFCSKDTKDGKSSASSSSSADEAKGFNLTYLPGSSSSSSSSSGESSIGLVDLIFMGEVSSSSSSSSSGGATTLSEDFRKLFGDVTYSLKPNSTSTTTGFEAKYILTEPTISSADYFQEKLHVKFEKLRQVTYELCKWAQDGTITNANKDFVKEKIKDEDFIELSIPGFIFNASLFDLFSFHLNELPDIADKRINDCKELETEVPVYTAGAGATPLQKWIDDIKPGYNGSLPEIYRLMLNISRRLALGEILTEGALAEQLIGRLSANIGAAETADLRVEGLKLIYRTLGTTDIRDSMMDNVEALRAIISASGARAAEARAQGGGK